MYWHVNELLKSRQTTIIKPDPWFQYMVPTVRIYSWVIACISFGCLHLDLRLGNIGNICHNNGRVCCLDLLLLCEFLPRISHYHFRLYEIVLCFVVPSWWKTVAIVVVTLECTNCPTCSQYPFGTKAILFYYELIRPSCWRSDTSQPFFQPLTFPTITNISQEEMLSSYFSTWPK